MKPKKQMKKTKQMKTKQMKKMNRYKHVLMMQTY